MNPGRFLLLFSFIFLASWGPEVCAGQGSALFESIKGWGVLRLGEKIKRADSALKKAGISFEEKRMHKDGTTVFILNRGGWEGTVYFDEKDRMTQILFQSPYFKHASEAEAAVKKIEDQFGPAHEAKTQTDSDGMRADTSFTWKNSATILTITKAHYLKKKQWIVWESYAPATN